jgi:hypothetical protein
MNFAAGSVSQDRPIKKFYRGALKPHCVMFLSEGEEEGEEGEEEEEEEHAETYV